MKFNADHKSSVDAAV